MGVIQVKTSISVDQISEMRLHLLLFRLVYPPPPQIVITCMMQRITGSGSCLHTWSPARATSASARASAPGQCHRLSHVIRSDRLLFHPPTWNEIHNRATGSQWATAATSRVARAPDRLVIRSFRRCPSPIPASVALAIHRHVNPFAPSRHSAQARDDGSRNFEAQRSQPSDHPAI